MRWALGYPGVAVYANRLNSHCPASLSRSPSCPPAIPLTAAGSCQCSDHSRRTLHQSASSYRLRGRPATHALPLLPSLCLSCT